MTDGQQSWSRDQIPLRQAIHPFIKMGVLRYAIGIGSEISPVELEVIAGENVVLAEDFDELLMKIEDQIGLIGTEGCKGKRPASTWRQKNVVTTSFWYVDVVSTSIPRHSNIVC